MNVRKNVLLAGITPFIFLWTEVRDNYIKLCGDPKCYNPDLVMLLLIESLLLIAKEQIEITTVHQQSILNFQYPDLAETIWL